MRFCNSILKAISLIFLINQGSLYASECLNKLRPFFNKPGRIESIISRHFLYSTIETTPAVSIASPRVAGQRVHEVFYSHFLDYQVDTYTFEKNLSVSVEQGEKFLLSYQNRVAENIDFVLQNYRERRDWSEEFLSEVRDQAFAVADRATYITVKKYDSPQTELWGTIKLVRSHRYSPQEKLLPMEEALGIKLPFNHGYKFEPSNFAVDKSHYKEAMANIIIQLSRFAKKMIKDHPRINPMAPLFYTYADRESRLMYSTLGFRISPQFPDPIIKDGKEWWVMSLNANDMMTLPNRIHQTRSKWNSEDQLVFSEVSKLFQRLIKDAAVSKHKVTANIEWLSPKGPTIVGYSYSEPRINSGVRAQQISFYFNQFENYGMYKYDVPTDQLPLKNGVEIKFPDPNVKGFYQDGILEIVDIKSENKTEIKMKIDPRLLYPSHFYFKQAQNDEIVTEFNSFFY